MSEAALWQRIRAAVGHRGHFSRIEFNPTEGYPDTSYCIRGEEGHMELKYVASAPARENTPCFGVHGLRPAQVAWIHTRCKHGGRVYIVGGVGNVLVIVPGTEARRFNAMTFFQLGKVGAVISPGDWNGFLDALRQPMPRAIQGNPTE
jgi:hypothetical protein